MSDMDVIAAERWWEKVDRCPNKVLIVDEILKDQEESGKTFFSSGSCIRTLMMLTGLTKGQVEYAIREMEKAGELTCEFEGIAIGKIYLTDRASKYVNAAMEWRHKKPASEIVLDVVREGVGLPPLQGVAPTPEGSVFKDPLDVREVLGETLNNELILLRKVVRAFADDDIVYFIEIVRNIDG